jgi:hypothetical protein
VRARLYLDEDVIPDLARVLRSTGHDVVSAQEVGAFGIGDEEQLTRATADGRALLSFNYRHFLKIGHDWFVASRPHAGIVVSFRQYRRRELRELAQAVAALFDALTPQDLANSVRVLDEFRRVRGGR